MSVEKIKDEEGNDTLKYDAYVKHGNISKLRAGLSPRDPDQLYNYLKSNGIDEPEVYGIYHPVTHQISEKYKDYTNEQLLSIIAELTMNLREVMLYNS